MRGCGPLLLVLVGCNWVLPLERAPRDSAAAVDRGDGPAAPDGPETDGRALDASPGPDTIPAGSSASVRSIGAAGLLFDQGSASCSPLTALVRFSQSLPPAVGKGDRVVLGSGAAAEEGYVIKKPSSTSLVLDAPLAGGYENQPFRVERAYTTLQAWEDGRQGDLVARGTIEIGLVYNDAPLTSGLVIKGSTTDATHFMRLEVAQGQRHDGRAGSGARVVGDRIVVYDPHTVVDGLEVTGHGNRGSGGSQAAVHLWYAAGVSVRNMLIHDDQYYGGADGIKDQEASGTNRIYNNMIYGGTETAAFGSGISAYWSGKQAPLIYNNTVLNVAWGIVVDNTSSVDARNNLVLGADQGFAVDSGSWSPAADHNASDDGTAPGPGSLQDLVAADELVSTTPGKENLHLQAGAAVVDRAVAPVFMPAVDIDGQPRPGGAAWDIGADEL